MSCTVEVGVLFAHGMAIPFDGCICSSRLLVLYPLDIFARMTISVAGILNSDALANCQRINILIWAIVKPNLLNFQNMEGLRGLLGILLTLEQMWVRK